MLSVSWFCFWKCRNIFRFSFVCVSWNCCSCQDVTMCGMLCWNFCTTSTSSCVSTCITDTLHTLDTQTHTISWVQTVDSNLELSLWMPVHPWITHSQVTSSWHKPKSTAQINISVSIRSLISSFSALCFLIVWLVRWCQNDLLVESHAA